jgi:hypothetical protein
MICLFSVGFYFDNPMHGHSCKASCMLSFLMFVLNPTGGLCCVWFIYPVLWWLWCPEVGTSSIGWIQLSRLLPENGDRVQFQKGHFKIRKGY